jgi:hypothetical protein
VLVGKSSFIVLQLVGNTYLLLINGGSVNRWWVGKNFIDVTYNDLRGGLITNGGSVKQFLSTHRHMLIMNRGIVQVVCILKNNYSCVLVIQLSNGFMSVSNPIKQRSTYV